MEKTLLENEPASTFLVLSSVITALSIIEPPVIVVVVVLSSFCRCYYFFVVILFFLLSPLLPTPVAKGVAITAMAEQKLTLTKHKRLSLESRLGGLLTKIKERREKEK